MRQHNEISPADILLQRIVSLETHVVNLASSLEEAIRSLTTLGRGLNTKIDREIGRVDKAVEHLGAAIKDLQNDT